MLFSLRSIRRTPRTFLNACDLIDSIELRLNFKSSSSTPKSIKSSEANFDDDNRPSDNDRMLRILKTDRFRENGVIFGWEPIFQIPPMHTYMLKFFKFTAPLCFPLRSNFSIFDCMAANTSFIWRSLNLLSLMLSVLKCKPHQFSSAFQINRLKKLFENVVDYLILFT